MLNNSTTIVSNELGFCKIFLKWKVMSHMTVYWGKTWPLNFMSQNHYVDTTGLSLCILVSHLLRRLHINNPKLEYTFLYRHENSCYLRLTCYAIQIQTMPRLVINQVTMHFKSCALSVFLTVTQEHTHSKQLLGPDSMGAGGLVWLTHTDTNVQFCCACCFIHHIRWKQTCVLKSAIK